jgi:hypothetical protein
LENGDNKESESEGGYPTCTVIFAILATIVFGSIFLYDYGIRLRDGGRLFWGRIVDRTSFIGIVGGLFILYMVTLLKCGR